MQISKLTIRNILGIEELEFSAGKFTVLKGTNGSGKTSVIEAIKAALKGGHDATLLRAGAEKGEIVLELDDGVKISKTVRQNTSDTRVYPAGGNRPLSKPMDLIKSLVDRLSNNPLEFLTAKETERVGILLQSIPVAVDHAKLTAISGVQLPEMAEDMHVFQLFDFVHSQVYDDRTGTNRAVDEKKKTIRQLRDTIPVQPEGVIGGEEELEQQLKDIDVIKESELTGVHDKLNAFVASVNAQIETIGNQHEQGIREFSEAMDAEIQAVQTQLDAMKTQRMEGLAKRRDDKAAAIKTSHERITSVSSKADTKRNQIQTDHIKARAPIETKLAVLRQNRDVAAKRKQTQVMIDSLTVELEQLEADVKRQETALSAIESYKSEVLMKLPIQGLEVKNGVIYRNGVAFDRLNLEQRIRIAVEIAKLRAGTLGVICVDGIEALDSHSFGEFQRQTEGTGLQFFVSRVSDMPFTIESDQPQF